MGQSDSDSSISLWTFDTPSNDLLFGLVGWQHGSGDGESSAQRSIIVRTKVVIGARLFMKNHGFPAIGVGYFGLVASCLDLVASRRVGRGANYDWNVDIVLG